MLSTARSERLPIIVLGLSSLVILLLWLRPWYNTMLSSRKTTIEEDHLPLLGVFELRPKFFQDPRVTWHAVRKPTNPPILTKHGSPSPQLEGPPMWGKRLGTARHRDKNHKWLLRPCLLGGHMWLEWLHNLCLLWGPQRQAREQNQKWLHDHYHLAGPYRIGYGIKCAICERKRPERKM